MTWCGTTNLSIDSWWWAFSRLRYMLFFIFLGMVEFIISGHCLGEFDFQILAALSILFALGDIKAGSESK